MSKTKRAWLAMVFLLIFAKNIQAEPIQNKIINIARTQIGKGETTANNQGPDIDKYFNKSKACWGWCSAFVSWVLYKAEITELGYQTSSRKLFNIAKKLGWTHNNIPISGDLIVFWRESKDSWKGHIEIVEHVIPLKNGGYKVITIAGNVGKFPAIIKRVTHKRTLNHEIDRLLGYVRIKQ